MAALALTGCRDSSSPAGTPWEDALAIETALLGRGDFRSARAGFKLVAADPAAPPDVACRAEYGYILSITFEFIGSLLDASDWFGDTNGNDLGELLPLAAATATATTELDSLVSSFVDAAIDGEIDPLLAAFDRYEAHGACSIRVPGGIPLETASRSAVRLGERFDESHVHLLAGLFRTVRGLTQWLTAWDLRVDYQGVVELLQATGDGDPLWTARGLAGPIERSPDFLTLHAERGARLTKAGPDLRRGIADLRAGLRLLFAEGRAANRESVLGWVDASGDGRAGPGDELWLGLLAADPLLTVGGQTVYHYPVNLSDGDLGGFVGAALFSLVGAGWLDRLDALLARASDNLAGIGPLFNLAEVNTLLPLPLVPDVVALDLHRWFVDDLADAEPLRGFLPAWGRWAPPVSTAVGLYADYTSFLIEVELAADRPDAVTGEFAAGPAWCVLCAPGERFSRERTGLAAGAFTMAAEVAARLGVTEPTPIADDCLAPSGGDTYGYAWWQDPTLGGLLHIRAAGISPAESCPADPAAEPTWGGLPVPRERAVPADRYTLNRLLVQLAGGFPTDLVDF
jgi:hypothetical protein